MKWNKEPDHEVLQLYAHFELCYSTIYYGTVPLCGIDLLCLTKYTTFKKLVLLEKLSFLEHCLMAIALCSITRKRLGFVKFEFYLNIFFYSASENSVMYNGTQEFICLGGFFFVFLRGGASPFGPSPPWKLKISLIHGWTPIAPSHRPLRILLRNLWLLISHLGGREAYGKIDPNL